MFRLAGPDPTAANLAIITLADLQGYMHGPGTAAANTAVLQRCVDAVNAEIYSWTGGRIFKAVATDSDYLLDVDDPQLLMLPERPIVSIVAIENVQMLGGTNFQVLHTYTTQEYLLDSHNGFVAANGFQLFPTGQNTIRARFRSGYSTMPADIVKAALVWASTEARRALEARTDVLSGVKGDANLQYMAHEMPPIVRDILRNYRYEEATCG